MLNEMIVKVLADYEIPLNHVVCCVTDNASNMIKFFKLLNENIQERDVDEEEDDVDEDKEHGEEDDMEEGELWLESVIPPSCEHMQCAVHTLQLAVNDGIKHATVEGLCGRSGVLQKKPSTQYRQADVEICQKGSTH